MRYRSIFSPVLNKYVWCPNMDDMLKLIHKNEEYKAKLNISIIIKFWKNNEMAEKMAKKMDELIVKYRTDREVIFEFKKYYDTMKYKAEEVPKKIFSATLFKKINVGKPKSYLDYGCGDGKMTEEIGKYFGLPFVNGADMISPHNPNINFSNIGFKTYKLNFENDRFNFITIFEFLCKIPYRYQKLALLEINRVCEIGAIILVKDYDAPERDHLLHAVIGTYQIIDRFIWQNIPYNEIREHTFFREVVEWDELFSQCGFVVDNYPQIVSNIIVNPLSKFVRVYKKINHVREEPQPQAKHI